MLRRYEHRFLDLHHHQTDSEKLDIHHRLVLQRGTDLYMYKILYVSNRNTASSVIQVTSLYKSVSGLLWIDHFQMPPTYIATFYQPLASPLPCLFGVRNSELQEVTWS